ncbi:MAG TPA: hypothetical protein VGK29_04910 [Paludibaculum sp.]|jgi:hypothetical protein
MRGKLLLLAATVCLSQAAEKPTLAVVMEFPGEVSPAARDTFRLETERLLEGAGVEVSWRTPGQAEWHETFHRVVVLKFRDGCTPARTMERGRVSVLGRTFVTDGQVLPFIELDCRLVQEDTYTGHCQASSSACAARLGRALARVAAHEICHVLTTSGAHDKQGIMKPSFDHRDLCGAELSFSPGTVQRLRRSLGTTEPPTTAYSRSF